MWDKIKAVLAAGYGILIYWIKGKSSVELLLKERDAELVIMRERVSLLEAAAAKERAKRLQEVDEEAATIIDANGSAELLRRITGASPPDSK
jgi:hypothetical protein